MMKSESVLMIVLIALLGVGVFVQSRQQAQLEKRLQGLDARVETLAEADVERERVSVLGESARVEREGRVYFPDSTFDTDPARDAVLADVYARPLRAADLPSFWTRTLKGPDPSNHYMQDPQFRLVRLTPGGLKDYTEVYREVVTTPDRGAEGHPLVAQVKRVSAMPGMSFPYRFTAEQEKRYFQLLKDLDFWAMTTIVERESAAKGDRTLIEGFDGGKYHAAIRSGGSSAAWDELNALVRKVAQGGR